MTRVDPDTEKVLLSAYIPVKKEDGWHMPEGQALFYEIWVPNLLNLIEDDGPVEVDIQLTEDETGVWAICYDDYFFEETHIYTVNYSLENVGGRWKINRKLTDTSNDDNEGFGLHVCIKGMKSGDVSPVTFVRK